MGEAVRIAWKNTPQGQEILPCGLSIGTTSIIDNLTNCAKTMIAQKGLWQWVDKKKFLRAMESWSGLPVDISRD